MPNARPKPKSAIYLKNDAIDIQKPIQFRFNNALVTYLNNTITIDEQILWFQITMQNAALMAK